MTSDEAKAGTTGETFKDLFESAGSANVPRANAIRVGDKLEGVVSHVGPSAVFVELDGKAQAYFDLVDVAGPDGASTLTVGERTTGVVASIEPKSGQIRLARRFGKEANV